MGLRSFFKEAFLRDKFLSLGIPLPAWSIPADADEDPDIPASATQLQMMVYNATIAKNEKLRKVKVSYTAAELACETYFKSLLGAAPLRLIALESSLATDYTVLFTVLLSNYNTVGSEPLENLVDKLSGPFDSSAPFSSFVGTCKKTHATFFHQTRTDIPDKLKMFYLRKAVASTPHLYDAREKYTTDTPSVSDQTYAGLLAVLTHAAMKYEEAHPPASPPLFGGSATTSDSDTFMREDGRRTWTRLQIRTYSTLPNPKWKLFCCTCGTSCAHDSAGHIARDGPRSSTHDDSVTTPGSIGKQSPFKAKVYFEAVKLKAKYKLA